MPRPHRDSRGYYRTLGLDPEEATPEAIQLAFEALSEKALAGNLGRLAEIERAYKILNDPASRRAYDQMARMPPRRRRAIKLNLDSPRLLAACLAILVAILGFVWLPLYGSRLRSFAAGDRLVDLKGSPFGVVLQVEERHAFVGGGAAPAYLIQIDGSGELRWFPSTDLQAACRRAR